MIQKTDEVIVDPVSYPALSREIITKTTYKRTLITVAIGLTLVFLVNLAAIAYFRVDRVNLGNAIVRHKWDLLQTREEPLEWMILGDSSANQGLIPAVWNETFAGETLNLATLGDWTYLDSTWMLEMYIDKFGEPPPNVVIMHVYNVYSREINAAALNQIPAVWEFWGQFTVQPQPSPLEQLKLLALETAPLLFKHQTLQQAVYLAVTNPQRLTDADELLQPSGYMPRVEVNVERVESELLEQQQFVDNRSFRLSSTNEESFEFLLSLLEEYDFTIYIANSPLYEELAQDPDFERYFSEVRATVQDFADRHPNLHYLDNESYFPATEMEAVDHIVDAVADDYTRSIAELVQNIATEE